MVIVLPAINLVSMSATFLSVAFFS
jgi:hypothetical protein